MKRWPLHKAAFWEIAPFFRLLPPFVAGVLCYYSTPLVTLPVGYVLILLGLTFAGYITITLRGKLYGIVPFLLLHLFVCAGGFSLAHFADDRNNSSWYGNSPDSHATYLALITGAPAEKETAWKLPVQLLAKADSTKAVAVTGKAILYLYNDGDTVTFQQGDTILVPGDWSPIKNAGNPFEFDYAAYCRRNNIFHQQFCSLDEVRLYGITNPTASALTDRAHNWCMQQLERFITDHKTMGLLQAMLLGDEVNLDPELRQSFSDTGIVHIIAISGGNVAIFFIVISALLWWMRDKRHLWLKYAIALPLVWFYVIMAGSSPSAVRAAVMFSLLAFGVMLQKNNNSLNQLFATAFILLCAQPAWLYSLGFQLSFVAVLSLVLFYAPVYKWISPVSKVARTLWSVVAASIAAEILVAPLVVYYFHNFPLLFLVANVAAYIFMSIVLILGIAVILLSWLPAIASFIGVVTVALVTSFDKLITGMQQFNPASLRALTITAAELLLIYLIITGLSVFMLRKLKPAVYVAGAAAILLLLSFCCHEWVWLRQQRLVVYNTGHINRVELISGKQYKVLSGAATGSKITYATMPGHINWQALSCDSSASRSCCYHINGKTVLMLRNGDSTAPFHADYLVLSGSHRYNAADLKQRYTPSLVVLSTGIPPKQQNDFCKECTQARLNVHLIAENGAMVIE